MFEALAAWGIGKVAAIVGGSIAAFILTWILKKIPTEKIRKAIYGGCYFAGAGISKFFNSWKYTKAVYENTLEPWLIQFLEMTIVAVMSGLFDGMRSDNKKSDSQ